MILLCHLDGTRMPFDDKYLLYLSVSLKSIPVNPVRKKRGILGKIGILDSKQMYSFRIHN